MFALTNLVSDYQIQRIGDRRLSGIEPARYLFRLGQVFSTVFSKWSGAVFTKLSIITYKWAKKAGAFVPSRPFRCFTLGYAPCFLRKHYTKLENLSSNKHSSLMGPFVSHVEDVVDAAPELENSSVEKQRTSHFLRHSLFPTDTGWVRTLDLSIL